MWTTFKKKISRPEVNFHTIFTLAITIKCACKWGD